MRRLGPVARLRLRPQLRLAHPARLPRQVAEVAEAAEAAGGRVPLARLPYLVAGEGAAAM